MGTQPNGPIRELRWWQIPSWIPRWRVGLTGALVGGLSVGVGVCLVSLILDALVSQTSTNFIGDLLAGLVFGLFGALMVGLVSVLGVKADHSPIDGRPVAEAAGSPFRGRDGATHRALLASWLLGSCSGSPSESMMGLRTGSSPGVVGGLMFGLIVGVVAWSPARTR